MTNRDGVAIQDRYPEDFSHCYGCGRLNPLGHRLRTFVDGDETVAWFTPRPEHIAVPGFVYGGLVASLIDCHAMATAAAAMERRAGQVDVTAEAPRFVTASLRVDYLRPTPHGAEIEVRARATEVGDRKVTVDATLSVAGVVTARGHAVAVRMPEAMAERSRASTAGG